MAAAALLIGCGHRGEATSAATVAPPPPEKTHRGRDRPRTDKKLERVNLTLDEHEGPTSAGIIMAADRGYFADVGLSVGIYDPQTPNRPVRYVSDGTVDLGVTHLPEVALAQERGAPIIAVGSLLPQATAALIWTKDSKINGIEDLRGKTIAITGLPFQERFLDSVLARHGLDRKEVKVKRVGYELVNSLLFGHADAIFGGSWNLEGIELEQLELKPTITRVRSLGIPSYDELVVIARDDRVAKDPGLIRRFMSAVAHGTIAAANDPAAAVEAIEAGDEGNPDATPEATEAEAEATLPLLSRNGYISPRRARRLGEWMFAQGMLKRRPRVSDLLTNRYR
jgi:putative hydroxymethylpyrimidine transport system substrate-binding protein